MLCSLLVCLKVLSTCICFIIVAVLSFYNFNLYLYLNQKKKKKISFLALGTLGIFNLGLHCIWLMWLIVRFEMSSTWSFEYCFFYLAQFVRSYVLVSCWNHQTHCGLWNTCWQLRVSLNLPLLALALWRTPFSKLSSFGFMCQSLDYSLTSQTFHFLKCVHFCNH